MISADAIKDLLDANTARREAKRPVILTGIGEDMLRRLLREMDNLKLNQTSKDIVEQQWP